MTPYNISVCFGPIFFGLPDFSQFSKIMNQNAFVELLIKYSEMIFQNDKFMNGIYKWIPEKFQSKYPFHLSK